MGLNAPVPASSALSVYPVPAPGQRLHRGTATECLVTAPGPLESSAVTLHILLPPRPEGTQLETYTQCHKKLQRFTGFSVTYVSLIRAFML